ncbi:MAG TPA: DUF2917 domain-containing protein [Burkholderiaceae bacterium]|nr:DUF2917 domain-containing protein [Burkholderiaceae bacterium]
MNWARTTTRTIDLGYEQLLTFVGRPGTRVRVLFGSMWLTEEGCEQDVFVCCGDEVLLKSGGLSVIEGLGAARVQVVEPAKRSLLAAIAGRGRNVWRRLPSRTKVADAMARFVILLLAIAVSAGVLHIAAPGPLSIQPLATDGPAFVQETSGPAAGTLQDLAAVRTGFLSVN